MIVIDFVHKHKNIYTFKISKHIPYYIELNSKYCAILKNRYKNNKKYIFLKIKRLCRYENMLHMIEFENIGSEIIGIRQTVKFTHYRYEHIYDIWKNRPIIWKQQSDYEMKFDILDKKLFIDEFKNFCGIKLMFFHDTKFNTNINVSSKDLDFVKKVILKNNFKKTPEESLEEYYNTNFYSSLEILINNINIDKVKNIENEFSICIKVDANIEDPISPQLLYDRASVNNIEKLGIECVESITISTGDSYNIKRGYYGCDLIMI